ncbi:signal-induced proliferation-associated 1-like protein 2 isoform X2 [Myxocyprinus asiaticus]|uniref:signal-induced proliferation-associated 1-like protein 2 isoform X2 n=1 Tax=Myxocyprinus asiaticus TaxID=70543 RepID=UPI002222974B|nr:signal-induced proliferation-associated 1-like protein 2 isoform X2 [Myxocyprinus asiaticus]
MQSDDLFIRKFRRQSPRPPLATVNFESKQDGGGVRTRVMAEWPPRREGQGSDRESVISKTAELNLRTVGHGHIMQRSNSDVTLGDLDSAGQVGRKMLRVGGDKTGTGGQGESLHREYGSLSSLERSTQCPDHDGEQQGALSPQALRFKDPLILLGLQETPPEPDGFFQTLSAPTVDTSKPAKPPKPEGLGKKAKPSPPQASQFQCDQFTGGAWVRNFAHYDVQSILFDLTEAATNRDSIGRKKNITSGASAASQLRPLTQSTPSSISPGGGGSVGLGASSEDVEQSLLDEGDGNDNDLLLSCPHFRNEMGGEESGGLCLSRGCRGRWRSLQSPNDAVSVLEEPRESHIQQQGKSNFFIEHADLGARYYHKYFYMKDHQNFFGMDERLGPVAVSFRREEKEGSSGSQYNYRIIFRTTELKTLRGSILEESVPSAARHTTPRGLSPKRLLEFILPDLNLHCLRLASTSPKVRETLLKLDEQGLNFQRKVGVMYCKAGQSTEEDMYNNESAGPAFDEFLDLLGDRVQLKGWEKYRAQLDTKTDSTGTHSLYTRYQDYEIMFHVSTMLPYTPNNTQQLLRKRHIGNDIVTIVFQEPGALPFTPKAIRSHFQHVFIIVQVHKPCADDTYYRVAVTRSKDIPLFGPLFPKGARFPRSLAFRDFLLAKAINAENAAEKSEKFRSMATRTRQEYLKDLAENYVTTTPIDSSTKFPLLSLGGKRKEKLKGAKGAELHSAGALVWAVTAVQGGQCNWLNLPCLLGVSAESVVLIERFTRRVVFNCSCRDVIGWKAVIETGAQGGPCLDIFYERGEAVTVSVPDSQMEDIKEVVQRLELVTRGCEAREITPLRDGVGQPGFLMSEEGFVTELQRFGYAESGGLQLEARVVRLCGQVLVHLSQEERSILLRTAQKIHITVIPPDKNGKPRKSFSELYQKAIQDAESKSGEGCSGEAWVLDERGEEADDDDGDDDDDGGEDDKKEDENRVSDSETQKKERREEEIEISGSEDAYSLLSPPSLALLRATSLQHSVKSQTPEINPVSLTRSYSLESHPLCQDILEGHVYVNVGLKGNGHIYENPGELRDATPDLILAVKSKVPPEHEEQFGPDKGIEEWPSSSDVTLRSASMERAERNSRALSLHNSITKILSETTDSSEEEWQSIADLATACRNILEALSREDRKAGDGSQASLETMSQSGQTDSKFKDSDSPGHLEEKVSQLEAMLKRLQDDLQKEKEDKALLQAEVQSLRQNNQRLQEESQSTVARLIKVTELLCNITKPS